MRVMEKYHICVQKECVISLFYIWKEMSQGSKWSVKKTEPRSWQLFLIKNYSFIWRNFFGSAHLLDLPSYSLRSPGITCTWHHWNKYYKEEGVEKRLKKAEAKVWFLPHTDKSVSVKIRQAVPSVFLLNTHKEFKAKLGLAASNKFNAPPTLYNFYIGWHNSFVDEYFLFRKMRKILGGEIKLAQSSKYRQHTETKSFIQHCILVYMHSN